MLLGTMNPEIPRGAIRMVRQVLYVFHDMICNIYHVLCQARGTAAKATYYKLPWRVRLVARSSGVYPALLLPPEDSAGSAAGACFRVSGVLLARFRPGAVSAKGGCETVMWHYETPQRLKPASKTCNRRRGPLKSLQCCSEPTCQGDSDGEV